jgi:hypothetical protein
MTIIEKIKFVDIAYQVSSLRRLFLINVFTGTKYFSSLLQTGDIRVPTLSHSVAPSVRCVSIANAICKCTYIFNNSCLSVKSLLRSIFPCFLSLLSLFFVRFVLVLYYLLLLFVCVLTL